MQETSFLLPLMNIVAPLLLLAGLAYGTWAWSKRRRTAKQAGERAAHRLFEQRDP